MDNAFFNIDPDDKVPESLKKALISEIDTLRNSLELVTLFVGNFFNTAGKLANQDSPKPSPQNNTNTE